MSEQLLIFPTLFELSFLLVMLPLLWNTIVVVGYNSDDVVIVGIYFNDSAIYRVR